MSINERDNLIYFISTNLMLCFCRRMKLKKEIQAIKELNEQEKQAQAAKAAAVAQAQCDQQDQA